MNLRQFLFAVLLSVMPSTLISAHPHPQHSLNSNTEKVGRLKGVVWGANEDFPGPWTIVIEHGSARQELTADDQGHFETKLPAGDYTAYLKPRTGQLAERVRRVPFRIQAGHSAQIELDPTFDYVYCSNNGEMVIPVRRSDTEENNLKGLHRPKVDTLVLKRSDKASLKVTFEYCGKAQSNDRIFYKSVAVTYLPFSIFAPEVEFNLRSHTLEGWGNIYVVQDGKRSNTPHFKADLGGGNVTSMSTSESRVRKPR